MASDSASKGMAVFVTGIVFLVLAALSVVFRLIARVGYLKNAGSDDAAIVIALVCSHPVFEVELSSYAIPARMYCPHCCNMYP